MERYSDTVRDQNGAAVVGALVSVRDQSGDTPVLYDDDGLVLDNPLTTDGYGDYYFNIAEPAYVDLSCNYGNRLVTREYGVPVGVTIANIAPLTYDLGTVTVSTPLTDLAETWNNAAVNFIGELRTITGTAYGASSKSYSYIFSGTERYYRTPKGEVHIGSYSPGSTESGVVVSRNLFDGATGNVHGFNHNDLIRRTGNMASASFDALPIYQANSYDHHAGFQDRPNFQLNGGSVVGKVYGLYSVITMDTGTISDRYGTYVTAPILTSGGAITRQYGHYVEALTTGGTNYAFYSAGATQSRLGGNLFVGAIGTASTDQVLTIGSGAGASNDPGVLLKRGIDDASVSNGHGFVDSTVYRRSTGTSAYAAFDANTVIQAYSYNHFVGFQDRPVYQAAGGGFTISDLWGVFSQPTIDAGVCTRRTGIQIKIPILSSGGTIGTQYGVRIDALTNAGTNWAFYSDGATASYLGGKVTIAASVATPAGGSAGASLGFGSGPGPGIFFGSGAPSVSAPKGSLYLRSDGTTTNDRAYINTNGTTGWTALTTAS